MDAEAAIVTLDDLDNQQVEQLYGAILQVSNSCFEVKKLCATVLIPAATFVSIFTSKRLTEAIFIASLLIVVPFWVADSVGFYYQRKLRSNMSVYLAARAKRCTESYSIKPVPTVSWFKAPFNSSMLFYLGLEALIGLGWTLFSLGLIH